MTPKIKRISILSLAVAAGAVAFSLVFPAQSFAAQDPLVSLCFRNRNIQVPAYLETKYRTAGATNAPCVISGT